MSVRYPGTSTSSASPAARWVMPSVSNTASASRGSDRIPEQGGGARRTNGHPPADRVRPRARIAVRGRPARPRGQELRAPIRRGLEPLRIGAAFESVRRLRVEIETPPGQQHPSPGEVRALEQDVAGLAGHLRGAPAHDPRDRHRSLEVADQQVRGVELPLDVVEGRDALAVRGAPDDDAGPRQGGEVEAVQRLAELEHRVVRGVDDGVDGSHPAGGEPRLRPQRRRAVRHAADHAREVARTSVGVLDPHRRDRRGLLGGLLDIAIDRLQRHAGGRRHLPRHADDRQEVGAVRLHLDVEHRRGPARGRA